MNTADERWWQAQAGEYVLGTLRGAERDVFKKILLADEDIRSIVYAWQARLSPLDTLTTPITPPAHLFPVIMKRIYAQPGNDEFPFDKSHELNRVGDAEPDGDAAHGRDAVRHSGAAPDRGAARDPEPAPVRRRPEWRRAGHRSITGSRTFWKSVAGLATAAAIALSAVLLRAVDQPPAGIQVPDSVSIVQNEQREALWLLTTRTGSRTLQVLALAPPPVGTDQSYELWMVKPDSAGVEAVGPLPLTEGQTSLLMLPADTAVAELFAVSLEPRGGSPEAGPTGPVLFSGRIIDTTRIPPPR